MVSFPSGHKPCLIHAEHFQDIELICLPTIIESNSLFVVHSNNYIRAFHSLGTFLILKRCHSV